MPHYDFILAGGGAAGLSLALHLLRSPLAGRSILIVDKDAKDQDDRTWGYWSAQPTIFDEIVHRSWDRLAFAGQAPGGQIFSQEVGLNSYRYQMIRGLDFYRFTRQEIASHPNVEFRQGNVSRLEDGDAGARVFVDSQIISAGWVFDSIYRPGSRRSRPGRGHDLKLLFKGWAIETSQPAFDPGAVTLMDFRTPQNHDVRFFYLLPYSSHRALVEYTLFTTQRPSRDEYEQALRSYIREILGIQHFDLLNEESGCLPLTASTLPRRAGKHILTTGAKAGLLKPTTGYAFTRIQRDSAAIVNSLVQKGHPFDIPGSAQIYSAMDAILLDIMRHQGDEIKPVFGALFQNNPIERILRFLDEDASPLEIGAIIASLPPGLFLRTLARSAQLRQQLWESLLPWDTSQPANRIPHRHPELSKSPSSS
jgi:lycopene beta-cyclase